MSSLDSHIKRLPHPQRNPTMLLPLSPKTIFTAITLSRVQHNIRTYSASENDRSFPNILYIPSRRSDRNRARPKAKHISDTEYDVLGSECRSATIRRAGHTYVGNGPTNSWSPSLSFWGGKSCCAAGSRPSGIRQGVVGLWSYFGKPQNRHSCGVAARVHIRRTNSGEYRPAMCPT